MKLKKVLNRLSKYLDAERREQLEEYESIKQVLKKLKTKRDNLAEKINFENDDILREKLQGKLDVVNAQRRKGLKLLKELKLARDKK